MTPVAVPSLLALPISGSPERAPNEAERQEKEAGDEQHADHVLDGSNAVAGRELARKGGGCHERQAGEDQRAKHAPRITRAAFAFY